MLEAPRRLEKVIKEHFGITSQDDAILERNSRNVQLAITTVLDAVAAVLYFGFHEAEVALGLVGGSAGTALLALISEGSRRRIIRRDRRDSNPRPLP